jgi:hypothetical protein
MTSSRLSPAQRRLADAIRHTIITGVHQRIANARLRYGNSEPSPAEKTPTPNPVHPGAKFVHAQHVDPHWRPGPGQYWILDAPNRIMRVTRVSDGIVYFHPADSSYGDECAPLAAMGEGGLFVGRWLSDDCNPQP